VYHLRDRAEGCQAKSTKLHPGWRALFVSAVVEINIGHAYGSNS
jgi:hypothetical protein